MQETHKIARENLIKEKNSNKQYYDQNANILELHVGDKVLLKEQNKKNALCFNWSGPYDTIYDTTIPFSYIIQ
ncbi:Retrovirus-related Pol polyprotein [Aphis craccivora]|uniref:Retrovirus-related Pol polyprotein n=1 Tax=Aphis craccivora TaxID=307492 RepID=A0A6G0VJZ3_APHCR|nr:Retrovirus-related Pol polyprotein [Aphis craccivora]